MKFCRTVHPQSTRLVASIAPTVHDEKNGRAHETELAPSDRAFDEGIMVQKKPDSARLDRIVAETRRNAEQREQGYRERALKIYPWICGRCMREFTRENLSQLTVHHRNHNHDDNPPDGSNWELLCLYCHDNEHSRYLEADRQGASAPGGGLPPATHNPFAALSSLIKKKP